MTDRIDDLLNLQGVLGRMLTIYEQEYAKGTPMVTDVEYDRLFDLLVFYEKKAEDLYYQVNNIRRM